MAYYEQSLQDRWTKVLKRLQAYQQEHNGSCNVPAKYRPDPQLGRWVAKQRDLYKKVSFAKERCDQLEAIGFIDLPLKRYPGWAQMFKRLQAYQQEHDGSCKVPKGYPADPQLGNWVHNQRKFYRKGLLTKERCDQLEAIGFEWTRNPEWTEMLKRLQAYQQEHNDSCNVPFKYPPDQQLAYWVGTQRANYRKGLLTKERYDQLEAIGFQWISTRRRGPLSEASKSNQSGTQGSRRECWL